MVYQAGAIGVGGVGGSNAEAYLQTDGIDLVAIADVDTNLLAEKGDAWDIPEGHRYTSHEEMLSSEPLDAVVISTPTVFHRQHVLDAVELADPAVIWSEKPIAESVTDAAEMVDTCKEHNTELLIDHTRRFADKYQLFREAIQSDDLLGAVKSIHIEFGEELLRNGTHLIDLVVFLLGVRGERVHGAYLTGDHGMSAKVDEQVASYDDGGGGGILTLENGACVMIDHTLPRELSTYSLSIAGTEGAFAVTHEPFDIGQTQYWQRDGRTHVEAELPTDLQEAWNRNASSRTWRENAVAHQVAIMDGEEENIAPGSEALHVLEILVAMFVAEYTQSQVELPLERPLRDVTITSW